ncbi:MAG: cyclopropane fatty acyl phospholipid synthase [Candidatus Thiosymbion ectosymbiont of Robbea hypermnestra]|nr:cyclopropane fatty acyl phospholipid synthase [Candidatus Thiosymbion ectosymbiont of Robbea hypermnestra]
METDYSHKPEKRRAPDVLIRLLASADVRFDGDRPWDIQVRDPAFYDRVLRRGTLGLGESYMDQAWESERLDETFNKLLRVDLNTKARSLFRLRFLGAILRSFLFNRQSRQRAFQVGEHHYDIGNDVYAAMLDPTMSYSCGYWQDATNLEQAQLAKLRLICDKLELKPGERLLDIGCGWGGLARFAARNYGVEVTGITISKEQQGFAREHCAGLPVTIELMDYRDLSGCFDKVVSVGMFEHVGSKNYPAYFAAVKRAMAADGLFLLHTIGNYNHMPTTNAWIDKYIFPNGYIPSPGQVGKAVELAFIIEDWHNFGQDYDRTLMAWWQNFDAAWPRLADQYDERFYRMFKYYLNSCAGYFRSRQGQLWQLVLSKRGRSEVYRSIRG